MQNAKTPIQIMNRVIENLEQIREAVWTEDWIQAREVLTFTIHIQENLLDEINERLDRGRGDKVQSNMTMQLKIDNLCHKLRRHFR